MRRFLSLIFLLAVVFASDAECSAMDQSTLTLNAGESKTICLDSSYRLRDIWSLRIVNITTSQELPSFTVDSPDSSSIRMITFLIGKLSGRRGFNTNELYDMNKNKAEKRTTVYLSPYGTTCFNITCHPKYKTQGLDVTITSTTVFDIYCPIKLVIGMTILLLSSKLSKSKSFYYITAASLSAMIGLLLIIFYIMKRMQASNTSMSVVAVAYSLTLSSLFKRSVITVVWRLCMEHYRIVLIYTIIFAFIGIIVVRLKIFSTPSSNPTSLFEVVRWALLIVSISLVFNSTDSVCGSLVSFLLMWFLIDVMRMVLRYVQNRFNALRFKFFPPKHVFKSLEQYEEEKQKNTRMEMERLRNRLLNKPDLLNRLTSCPKGTLIQFLASGFDVIDTTSSVQEVVAMLQKNGNQPDQSMRDYVYQQRNNQDLFFQNGEYAQMGSNDVFMTEEDANRSLIIQPDVYSEDEDDFVAVPKNQDIYAYDSDQGETRFFISPRRENRNLRSPSRSGLTNRSQRRETIASENQLHSVAPPTSNAWT
ncbi:hypothetical protein WA171_006093 [Blastocystis sp. BT1]